MGVLVQYINEWIPGNNIAPNPSGKKAPRKAHGPISSASSMVGRNSVPEVITNSVDTTFSLNTTTNEPWTRKGTTNSLGETVLMSYMAVLSNCLRMRYPQDAWQLFESLKAQPTLHSYLKVYL